MLQRILAGVDGYDGGRAALALAARLARAADGSLTAAHVVPAASLWPPKLADERALWERAHDLLEAETHRAGVAARCRVVDARSPARGLHELGERIGADLIVVGSTRRGRLDRVVAGDVARALLQGSRAAVAVVPAHLREPGDRRPVVGVGYDGAEPSRAALRWARDLAVALDAEVRAVCAAEPPIAFGSSVADGLEWTEPDEARERAAARTLESALTAGVSGEVRLGLARDALRELSEEVDLVVVGSRGFGSVRRTLLGSTSDHLVHDAGCPVVVVPTGVAHAEAPAAEPLASSA